MTTLTTHREMLKKLDHPTTSAEDALKQAGLFGWNVRREPQSSLSGVINPNREMLIRDSADGPKFVADAGSRYHITQNEEHIKFLDDVAYQSGGEFVAAQSFRGGALVYISLRLPDVIQVGGTDPVNLFLNGINSFDGSTHFMLSLDPVRAFCTNQLTHFRRNSIKFKHTAGLEGKVHSARESLALTLKHTESITAEMNRLADVTMTEAQFERVLTELWPEPTLPEDVESTKGHTMWSNRMDRLFDYYHGDANANIVGNAWGGLNAVIEYMDYGRTVKAGSSRAERALTNKSDAETKTRAAKLFASI